MSELPAILDQWTPNDVCAWLESLGSKYVGFAADFSANNVTGTQLARIGVEELEALGIKGFAQKKLIREIRNLQRTRITSQATPSGVLSPRAVPALAVGGLFQRINIEEIVFERKLGGTTLSAAFLGKWKNSPIVVKRMHRGSAESKAQLQRDMEQLCQLSHHCVVSIIGFSEDAEHFYLVYEFLDGGSADARFIRNKKPLAFDVQMRIATDTACGLVFLHSQGVLHCDVALRNILITPNGHAKLADLSCARLLGSDSEIKDDSSSAIVSSIRWMAPESIKTSVFSRASDVYMFGITLWELFARVSPYPDVSDLHTLAYRVCNEGLRPHNLPEDVCPTEVSKIMSLCWDEDSTSRPTMQAVLDQLEEVNTRMVAEPDKFSRYTATSYATKGGFVVPTVVGTDGVVEEKKEESGGALEVTHVFEVNDYQTKKACHARMAYFKTDEWTAPNGTRWHFRVYPNGGNSSYPNDVAVYLEMAAVPERTMKISYTMRLLEPVSKEFTEVREFGAGHLAWGRHAFFKQSEVTDADSIRLEVKLHFMEEDRTEVQVMSAKRSVATIYVKNWSNIRSVYSFGRYHKTAEWTAADGTTWHLRIYPNGGVSDYNTKVAVYVERSGDMDEGVVVKYNMKLITPELSPLPTFTETRTFSSENTAWGRHGFFPQDFVVPDDNQLVFRIDQIFGGEDIGRADRVHWNTRTNTATYRITINDYHMIKNDYGYKSYYETPVMDATSGRRNPFTGAYDNPTAWHLRIYPSGANDSYRNSVGVYLERHEYDDSLDRALKVEYTLKLVQPEKTFTETRTFSKANMAWGRHGLFTQLSVADQNPVVLEVTLRVIGGGNDNDV